MAAITEEHSHLAFLTNIQQKQLCGSCEWKWNANKFSFTLHIRKQTGSSHQTWTNLQTRLLISFVSYSYAWSWYTKYYKITFLFLNCKTYSSWTEGTARGTARGTGSGIESWSGWSRSRSSFLNYNRKFHLILHFRIQITKHVFLRKLNKLTKKINI